MRHTTGWYSYYGSHRCRYLDTCIIGQSRYCCDHHPDQPYYYYYYIQCGRYIFIRLDQCQRLY